MCLSEEESDGSKVKVFLKVTGTQEAAKGGITYFPLASLTFLVISVIISNLNISLIASITN